MGGLGARDEVQSGMSDSDTPIFLAISCEIAAVVNGDWSRRRSDVLAAMQQTRLIAFDLNDQVIAGLAGDLEVFLAVHRVEREDAITQAYGGDQRLRGGNLVRLLVDDLVSEVIW